MNKDFQEVQMADLMDEFHDGPHATPPPSESGPVYLGIKNLTESGHLDLHQVRHISDEDFGRWTKRVTPREDDIVFTYEATLHRYARIPRGFAGCLGRRLALIRPDRSKVDPRFLHQALLGPDWRATVEDRVIAGATVDRIPIVDFPSFPISLPTLRTQRRIAAVLSAFDELIEINERRVEVLAGLARSLHREFFGRRTFSAGTADVCQGDCAQDLEDGWGWKMLGDVSKNLDRLRRPLSRMVRKERQGPFPYYGAAKLIDHVDGWLFEGEHLLFAEDGTVQTPDGYPVLQLVDQRFWANNHTHILVGDGISTRYLYLAMQKVSIKGFVTGAAQPKITQANLKRIPVLVGPQEVHKRFDRAINPVLDQIHELRRLAAGAASTRDLLLPRLVSGRLDISDIDLGIFEPAEAA